MKKDASCRSCGKNGLHGILDLGRMPLAGALLTEEQLKEPEPYYPLEAALCPDCSLVQIIETVPPEVLFCRKYPYYSSFSDELLRHSRQNALELVKMRGLGPKSLVVEIASNDGYLLRNFVERGIPCLGIDPAEGQALAARRSGVNTLDAFFSESLARELKEESGSGADVIIANNVLAHASDINGFLAGIKVLLKDGGAAVIEVPYVRDLIEKCEFDTIYHEHLCYFSVTSLDKMFRRHSLFLNDIKRLAIHGGSLRLYVGQREDVSGNVKAALEEESSEGMDRFEYYEDFAERVKTIKETLRANIFSLKASGKRIAAYGAAAKGSTLLNYAGIGHGAIDFAADRNIHKHGLFMPGVHIPIHSPSKLIEDMPDYVLMLAWNFAGEILEQQKDFISMGGRFILPIPEWSIA